jgi:hypothetical protein
MPGTSLPHPETGALKAGRALPSIAAHEAEALPEPLEPALLD